MSIPESILTDELAAGLERDPAEVLADVVRGALSVEAARERYAVVFAGAPGEADFAVDGAATETLREATTQILRYSFMGTNDATAVLDNLTSPASPVSLFTIAHHSCEISLFVTVSTLHMFLLIRY